MAVREKSASAGLFCDDCSGMIFPTTLPTSEKGAYQLQPEDKLLGCRRCDITYVMKGELQITHRPRSDKADGVAVAEGGFIRLSDWHCEGCGSDYGSISQVHLDRADEPETTFYRCGNCGKVEREGGT